MLGPLPKPQTSLPSLGHGQTNVDALKPIINQINKINAHLQRLHLINGDLALSLQPEVMRLAHALGVDCEATLAAAAGYDAVPQAYVGTDFEDTTARKYNFKEVYDLPYDNNDIVLAMYHQQAGRHVPINMRTVRHARTVVDRNGDYPQNTVGATDGYVVYPFRFIKICFCEIPEPSDPSILYLCPQLATEDGYFLNLECGTYLERGTDVWIYSVTGQWFTHARETHCESGSSASDSKSTSQSCSC